MLGLHRAALSVNRLIRAASQLTGLTSGDEPAADGPGSVDKIGEAASTAANATGQSGGLLEAVATLPQSVQEAAQQVSWGQGTVLARDNSQDSWGSRNSFS
jgi:hypothetical protein